MAAQLFPGRYLILINFRYLPDGGYNQIIYQISEVIKRI